MTTDYMVAFTMAANDPHGERSPSNVSQIAKELAMVDRRVVRNTLNNLVAHEIADVEDGRTPLYRLIVKDGRTDWDRAADLVLKAGDDIRAVRNLY
jgi:hypothetical protein